MSRQQFRESLARRIEERRRDLGPKAAVCRVKPATQVDHCHESGIVRGMVCMHCNAAMGAFHDDPVLIRKAVAYLQGQADEQ